MLRDLLTLAANDENSYESQLVEITECIASLTIDTCVKETASETLEEYRLHVETAQAIEERLSQLSEEIVESEQSAKVKTTLNECLEIISFEHAIPLASD